MPPAPQICKTCGKTFRSERNFPTCYDCFQKEKRQGRGNSYSCNPTQSRDRQSAYQDPGLEERFLISSYADSKNPEVMDARLVSGDASCQNNVQQLAQMFATSTLTTAQLRRIYDEALGYAALDDWAKIRVQLDFLLSKAAYSLGRKTIPPMFFQFLQNRISVIRNREDFDWFLKHMLAVVAYFKFYKPK